MVKVADVFINLPIKTIDKAYTYLVPNQLSFLAVGWRVIVPFGSRTVEGFITKIGLGEANDKLKEIVSAVDEEAWFNAKMLKVAFWLADFYLCSPGEAMRLFMPGKSGSKITPIYSAIIQKSAELDKLTPDERCLYDWLVDNPASDLQTITANILDQEVKINLQRLFSQHYLIKSYRAAKTAAPKFTRYFYLTRPLTSEDLVAFRKKPAQAKALELLNATKELSIAELQNQKISNHTIQQLCQSGLVTVEKRQVLRDMYKSEQSSRQSLTLTVEQTVALSELKAATQTQQEKVFLLHGVTGSGKTQVYIELVRQVRLAGKRAIVLVPEIGLTSQMIRQFQAYFPDEVVVIHSRLTLGERNDAITRIRRGEAFIVIGARSALFTPIDDLGVIILDEEHDASYKQDEAPRYHTRDVAKELIKLHNAVLVLGSATPSIESFYAAKTGTYKLLSLNQRVGSQLLPLVKTVDLRAELRLGRRNILSLALRQLLTETLQKGEQAIILLNRRGYSTFVMCRECGHVITCANCTLPLVYHKDGSLQCHFCDIHVQVPDICPECHSRYIKYFGSGTERLEMELNKFFPAARTIRMDRDTTGKKLAHQEILQSFANHKYDILLGTQMVAKGHDIHNVTAVGIISADASLNIPDFRAAERCFGLITQAAGRAGRGAVRGKVIVQTYNPEHYAVIWGVKHDYFNFYQTEVQLRRQLSYPPFSDLIKITIQNIDCQAVINNSEKLAEFLRYNLSKPVHRILGPAPAAIPKLHDIYRYTILIASQDITMVKKLLQETKIAKRQDLIFDVNPLQVL